MNTASSKYTLTELDANTSSQFRRWTVWDSEDKWVCEVLHRMEEDEYDLQWYAGGTGGFASLEEAITHLEGKE